MSEPEYSLPGVLHYLQAEWRKFEREKNEWAIERAELQARIALLEGERRGIENIKLTMMKRVKMLEYALRQERKRHASETTGATVDDDNENTKPSETTETTKVDTNHIVDNKMKEKSREVLRSCLQEINYLTSFPSKLPLTNAFSSTATRSINSSVRRAPPPPPPTTTNGSPSQNSPVLAPQQARSTRTSNSTNNKPTKKKTNAMNSSPIPKRSSLSSQLTEEEDEENMEVPANVDEVAMINNIKEETEHYKSENNESLSMQIQEKFHLSEEKVKRLLKHADGKPKLQEDRLLAGDFDPNQIGEIDGQQLVQPKIWKPRVTIKGHLDSVRAVCFHPNEMVAVSGSDDGTVKIWNLQRTTGKDGSAIKKGSLEEADPSITFRGHTNVVTAVVISASQSRVYSASLDSTIRVWSLPAEEMGPFSPVDPSLNIATYIGHTDAVWDFSLSCENLLASVSADGTVKIWDTESKGSLLKSSWTYDGLSSEDDTRVNKIAPTSVAFLPTERNRIAVTYANAKIRVYNIETGQMVMTFKGSDDSFDNTFATQINRIVAHPSIPILVSGHEDRHIKFYDTKTGECIQSVSGHLDAVTSLDIKDNTMVSGGHDSSIRLWDMATKTCIQEFSAHRRKGDEGVLSVQFHPSFPWMVSGGADGIVKLYHHGH